MTTYRTQTSGHFYNPEHLAINLKLSVGRSSVQKEIDYGMGEGDLVMPGVGFCYCYAFLMAAKVYLIAPVQGTGSMQNKFKLLTTILDLLTMDKLLDGGVGIRSCGEPGNKQHDREHMERMQACDMEWLISEGYRITSYRSQGFDCMLVLEDPDLTGDLLKPSDLLQSEL